MAIENKFKTMKIKIEKYLMVVSLLGMLVSAQVYAQDYKLMMHNPKYNVYEVKQAAEQYFDSLGVNKGHDWKEYQRWLYISEARFYPSGDRMLKVTLPDLNNRKSILKSTAVLGYWSELGPVQTRYEETDIVKGIGRTDPVWVDPENENFILSGSRTGGLWKTSDGGYHWECLTSHLNVIGVNAIAVSPDDKNVIFIGSSGGKDYWTPYGQGVLKSYDGGDTWKKTAISSVVDDNLYVSQVTIHPDNADIVLVSTNKGLYKSTDGLQTVTLVYSGNIHHVVYKPGAPENVYMSLNNSYVSYILVSTDMATTFSARDISVNDRHFLGVTAANPDYVYIANKGGIWRSDDGGLSFGFRGEPADDIWEGFAVSQTDPEVLFYGTSRLYISHDGGESYFVKGGFTGDTYNYPNLDQFAGWDFRFITNVNGTFYYGCDAFLGKSEDNGASFEQLHRGAIGIRENYTVSSSVVNPQLIMAGSQDHGTYLYNEGYWNQILGGDGMWNGFDRDEANVFFYGWQNGPLMRTENGGRNYVEATPPGMAGQGAWLTPYTIDEQQANTIYGGFSKVWKSSDNGRNWIEISGEIFGGKLNILEVAPSNSNVIFAARQNQIWRTSDGGSSWNEITSGLPNKSVTDIEIDPEDSNSVLVSYHGYTCGAKVYHSIDGGETWKNITGNLPNIPAQCVINDKGAHHPVYVGMDMGVYYTDDNLEGWIPFLNNMPMATVQDLEINYTVNKIRAGLWGRGLWEIDRLQATPAVQEYCNAYGKKGTGGDYISKVEISDINKTSGKSANLYSNFLSSQTKLKRDESVELTVTLYNHWANDRVYAWIDWNQNKQFEADEIVLSSECDAQHRAIATVTVPLDALPGETWMRVRNQYSATATPDPCGNVYYGEVEDYTIEVTTGAPVANFVVDRRVIGIGEQVTFKDLSTNFPDTYQWTLDGATEGNSEGQNPVVTYNIAGQYAVSLEVSNDNGTDIKTKVGHITVFDDVQAPGKPLNLALESIGARDVTLGWDEPSDNKGVAGYHVYLGSRRVTTITATQVSLNSLTEGSVYTLGVTAFDDVGNESEKAKLEVATAKAYCMANGASGTGDDFIINVTLGDISNTSGKSDLLYENFSQLSTNLEQGKAYNITVTLQNHWAADRVFAWIDWNGDKTYTDDELVLDAFPDNSHKVSDNITVPENAKPGNTEMRVRNQYNANEPGDPCSSSYYGEVEDYGINIILYTAIGDTGMEGDLYAVTPNPADDFLNVKSFKAGRTRVKLCDIYGKKVLDKHILSNAGKNTRLDVSYLKTGLYILILTQQDHREVFKVLVR